MTNSNKLVLDPGDIGGPRATLMSQMKDGWDIVESMPFSWDGDGFLESIEKGYTVSELPGKVVLESNRLYAHVYTSLNGNCELNAVGEATALAKLVKHVQSNPMPAPVAPEGVYGVVFNHRFVDKFDDLSRCQYAFNNKSDHLANLQPELYPKVDAEKLMELYTKSEESVLILTGEPGVGKTCFTKMLCKATAEIKKGTVRVEYVKDPEILKRDDFWIMMQNSEPDLLILDDLDDELKPRVDGKNTIMNHMLSFSDGIFPKSTKIIITTNQPNSAIDKAVTRPGRCFDILALPRLSVTEAKDIWAAVLGRTEGEFVSVFGDAKSDQSISQAALMSEHKRLLIADRPDYLRDKSISIRQVVEDGGLANAE